MRTLTLEERKEMSLEQLRLWKIVMFPHHYGCTQEELRKILHIENK